MEIETVAKIKQKFMVGDIVYTYMNGKKTTDPEIIKSVIGEVHIGPLGDEINYRLISFNDWIANSQKITWYRCEKDMFENKEKCLKDYREYLRREIVDNIQIR